MNAYTESEQQQLLDERQTLLDKKFDGSITRQEANRLEYVRWTLDRIELARYERWALEQVTHGEPV